MDQIEEKPDKCAYIGQYKNVKQFVCVDVETMEHPSPDVIREESVLFSRLLRVDAVVEKRVELHDPSELYE